MSWTGKAVDAGIGAFILGPVGAAIGGVAGHWFDQDREDQIREEVRWRLAMLSVLATAAAAEFVSTHYLTADQNAIMKTKMQRNYV